MNNKKIESFNEEELIINIDEEDNEENETFELPEYISNDILKDF